MNRLIPTALAGVLLASCSAAPPRPLAEPEFNAQIFEVSRDESTNYWTIDRQSQVDARRAVGAPATSYECRRAALAYTIDSNGRVFDIKIVDAWPNQAAARYFVAMRQHFRYEATAANPHSIPIRTIATHTAFRRGVDCEFPALKGLSWPDEPHPGDGANSPLTTRSSVFSTTGENAKLVGRADDIVATVAAT